LVHYTFFEYHGLYLNNAGRGCKISYVSRINYNGKNKHIGTFKTAKEAAEHYDACARLVPKAKTGRPRKLNFPQRSDWSHLSLPKWLLEANIG
jgi:hypothetical protein